MITFLYALWIAYTVGSLSLILLVVSLSVLSRWAQKRHDERIRDILSKRPKDEE